MLKSKRKKKNRWDNYKEEKVRLRMNEWKK
jgi:hypothetical protein